MVHVNDQTDQRRGDDPVRRHGHRRATAADSAAEANWDEFTQWQWVTVRDDAALVPAPRTERGLAMSSITEVARLAGVSIATASRVVSASRLSGQRRRPASACSTPPERSTTCPTRSRAACSSSQIPVVGVIVHDITDPYFAEIVRGVEDAAPPARLSSSSPAARSATATRERVVRPAAALDARGGRDLRRLAASTTRRSTRSCRGTSRRCASRARPSSTSRRTRGGEPEVGVDNAAGIASMVAALVALGPPADRVPRRAVRPVRRARAARRLPARAGRGGHASRTSGSSSQTDFDREGGALGRRRRCSRGERDVHGDRLRQRPARAGRAAAPRTSSASRVPGDVSVAGLRRHLASRR